MEEKEKCCICGKEIEGMDNNPYPVRTEGRSAGIATIPWYCPKE